MARKHCPNICGATYHVMNRGNRKSLIFEDDRDRQRFLSLLAHHSQALEVEVLGDCLMGNHFHLIVVTPHGNVSQFMQRLEGEFAQYSNWRHRRIGHLFQGPFKSVLIEDDIHLLTAACYVFMNPVAAGFCQRPDEWRWSTYAAVVGLRPAPEYLSTDWVGALFPADTLDQSRRRFHELMREARPVNSYLEQFEWVSQCDPMNQAIRSYVGERLHEVRVPREYHKLCRPPLELLIQKNMRLEERDLAIHDARVRYGYEYAEIAQAVNLRASTVGKIVSYVTALQRKRRQK